MTAPTIERHLALELAFNVRHLGGYRTAGGRQTSDQIIRGASLHRLTEASIATLVRSGLTTIVDLRSSIEVERDVTPNMGPLGVRTMHIPVFQSDAAPTALADNFPGFGPVYERFLESGGAAYRTLAEIIADADGAVLFHCAAGKDRTGVAAMLLLHLAGVEDADIVADYAASAALLEPERPAWLERMAGRGIPAEIARQLLGSHPAAMETTLDRLRRRWGGAAGYLRAQGMTGPRIEQLQDRLVD